MAEDLGGSRERGARSPLLPRGWGLVVAVGALLLAAIVGGVVGGVIVKETWSSSNGSPAAAASGSSGAACQAAKVADEALPSVVTVRAGNGQAAVPGRAWSSDQADMS